jgi:2-polyprenyl-3-methyl-5-hydroxy-6-metoxy-1,4-benzoquinol methylase
MPSRPYHEERWRRLPQGLEPADLAVRGGFLRANVLEGERVLDVGVGEGVFAALLVRSGATVVGIDVADEPLARARRLHPELDLRLVDGEGAWDLADASFDVVWAGEVIEHVADTARWLSEVRRVLAPGGRLLLSTPSHGRLRLLAGGIERFSAPLGDHLHLYSARSLRGLLAEFGFLEVRVRGAGGPPRVRRQLLVTARRP